MIKVCLGVKFGLTIWGDKGYFHNAKCELETWPSGRRRFPAKEVYGVEPYRGFESLRLRHKQIAPYLGAICLFWGWASNP